MKLACISFAILAALPSISLADEWTKHWSVSGKPELHVTAGDGSVEIKTGSNDSIDAVVRTKGYTIGESGIHIEEHQNGNRVELTVKEPHVHFSFNGSKEIKIEIHVPRDLAGYLRTGDGPISLEGIHGEVRAQTGDGPVTVEGFEGKLDAQTGDGPVTLQGRFDDLHVQTGDGPVNINVDHGSHIQVGWHLQTGDGPVKLRLPSDLSANLNLHSGDGPIQLDLPLTVSGSQDHHNVHGTLNGGGPEVSIHTGDGPITIGRS